MLVTVVGGRQEVSVGMADLAMDGRRGGEEGIVVDVGNVKAFAALGNDGSNFGIEGMMDPGEEVVLNLIIEAPEEEAPDGPGPIRGRGDLLGGPGRC